MFSSLDAFQEQQARETVSDILGVMARYAKGDQITIGVRQLARESRHTQKQVRKWLQRLEAAGILSVEIKGEWKSRTTTYRLARGAHSYIQQKQEVEQRDCNAGALLGEKSSFYSNIDTTSNDTYLSLEEISPKDAQRLASSECAPRAQDDSLEFLREALAKGPVVSLPDPLYGLEPDPERHKAWLRKERARKLEISGKLGMQFLMSLWDQVATGKSEFPIHPSALKYYQLSDDALEAFEETLGVTFEALFCFKGTRNLAPAYRNLPQPPLARRPRCPVCGRSMYLVFIRAPFGAIRWKCNNTKRVYHKPGSIFRDLWKQFPVFPESQPEPQPEIIKLPEVRERKLSAREIYDAIEKRLGG